MKNKNMMHGVHLKFLKVISSNIQNTINSVEDGIDWDQEKFLS